MNQIVLAAHGCPIHALGPYGNEWIATPNLDGLAASGVVYDRHFAERPDALSARREWWNFSSPRHRVLVRACQPEFDAPPELYTGFHEQIEARPREEDPSLAEPLLQRLPQVLAALADKSPWLVWIECDFLLPPWDAPQDLFEVYVEDLIEDAPPDAEPLTPWIDPPTGPFDTEDAAAWELLHRSYATAMTRFDAQLGQLLQLIEGTDCAFAFTSDWGYPLGEHGIVGPHRPWLHDEFVHLPLIVRWPQKRNAGTRVNRFTAPADVLAILEEAELPVRNEIISRCVLNGAVEVAVRTDHAAYLHPVQDSPEAKLREPQLYLKPQDRWEVSNLIRQYSEMAEEMEAKCKAT